MHNSFGSQHTVALRKAMRNATVEGLAASASDNLAGPYVSLFALSLGASNAQIGLINALTALMGNTFQLPFAALTQRRWRRKYWCVLSGIINRGFWILAALLPYYAQGTAAIWIFTAILTVRSLGAALGQPAWTALMADITPRRVRGSYFAYRNIMVNLAALSATLLGGWLIKQWGAPLGYQVGFGISCVFGLIAALVFARLQEPNLPAETNETESEVSTRTANMSVRGSVLRKLHTLASQLSGEKQFVTYMLTSLVWSFGVSLPVPLFPIYFVDRLGGNAYIWGLTTGTQLAAILLGQRYWGPLSDRFGGHRIMVISGVGAAAVPLLWWFASSYHFIYVVNVITGFAWAGYNLAAFNFLLEITPDDKRATYVAGYNGLIGITTAAAPFIGGLLSEVLGMKPVFVLSYALRMTGWALLARTVRPNSNRPLEWRRFLTLRL